MAFFHHLISAHFLPDRPDFAQGSESRREFYRAANLALAPCQDGFECGGVEGCGIACYRHLDFDDAIRKSENLVHEEVGTKSQNVTYLGGI